MLIKKAHTRCQFAKCTNAREAYAFYPSENAGHKPIVLCRKHLNEMSAELKKLESSSKREKREEKTGEPEKTAESKE